MAKGKKVGVRFRLLLATPDAKVTIQRADGRQQTIDARAGRLLYVEPEGDEVGATLQQGDFAILAGTHRGEQVLAPRLLTKDSATAAGPMALSFSGDGATGTTSEADQTVKIHISHELSKGATGFSMIFDRAGVAFDASGQASLDRPKKGQYPFHWRLAGPKGATVEFQIKIGGSQQYAKTDSVPTNYGSTDGGDVVRP